jgi:hypothetical protein
MINILILNRTRYSGIYWNILVIEYQAVKSIPLINNANLYYKQHCNNFSCRVSLVSNEEEQMFSTLNTFYY